MRLVIVFLLGVAVGYGIFSIQHERSVSIATIQSATPSLLSPPSLPSIVKETSDPAVKNTSEQPEIPKVVNSSGVVKVELYNGNGQQTFHGQGVIAGLARALVLPASVLRESRTGSVFDADGNQYAIGNVIAVNQETGIVALEHYFKKSHSLNVIEEESLYLGRDFVSLSLVGQHKGSIISSPIEQAVGVIVYTAHFSQSLDLLGSALLDTEKKYLLGIVIGEGENALEREVVDSTAVLNLLNSIPMTAPMSISEFSSEHIAKTPSGMFAQIASYMRANKWQEVIELSEQLIAIDALYFGRLKQNLEEAYASVIKGLYRLGKFSEAQEWLDRANSYLGDSAQHSILYSKIQYRLGNIKEARAALKQAIILNPELSGSILPELRRIVRAELNQFNRSDFDGSKIILLNEEIEFDPDYPMYHYLLGKFYFRKGDYEESIDSLYRAIYLDSSYENELLPVINAAQEKLDLPDLIEVPFTVTGKSIYVDVHLNKSLSPFHFVLDTGASYTSISKKVADQLGLFFHGNTITLNTANGQIIAPVTNLESVTLNGATVYNLQVVVLSNLDNIDGLLGLNFLSHFNMDMDHTNGKIGLSRR